MNMSLFSKTGKSAPPPKDFEKKRYLADLSLLAPLGEEKTKQYAMLVFTLLALSFFGIFAINPTITTIVELRKKLADSELANQQLEQKIAALSALLQEYGELEEQLPAVFAAIPQDPQTVRLLSQIQTMAEDHNITVTELKSLPVSLKADKKAKKLKNAEKDKSVSFTLEGQATYADFERFVADLTNFERIVTITQVTIAREGRNDSEVREILITGKAYYQE